MEGSGATPQAQAPIAPQLKLRGVNHLALMTDDMKETIDFYGDVLGIRLIHALTVPPGVNRGNPPFERLRHYFFDMGNDESLAFFELPKGAKPQTDRDAVGGMQHVSFTADQAMFETVQDRLKARGIPILGPIKILGGRAPSIYFYDHNDIRLELTCHLAHTDDPHVIDDMTMTKSAARPELMALHDDAAWVERTIAHLPD